MLQLIFEVHRPREGRGVHFAVGVYEDLDIAPLNIPTLGDRWILAKAFIHKTSREGFIHLGAASFSTHRAKMGSHVVGRGGLLEDAGG